VKDKEVYFLQQGWARLVEMTESEVEKKKGKGFHKKLRSKQPGIKIDETTLWTIFYPVGCHFIVKKEKCQIPFDSSLQTNDSTKS